MNSFQIDDINFIQDLRPGKDRGTSSGNNFILVKSPKMLEIYESLNKTKFNNILEVGMFEGGSMVYLDKLFKPDKLVGIDIREPIPALEQYRQDKEHIKTYYKLSQSDPSLNKILQENFKNGIDLIIDDASHHFELSRATFELTFPHLKPGGTYILEDWPWSLHPQNQKSDAPGYNENSLVNLIFELIMNMVATQSIKSIKIIANLAIIKKEKQEQFDINTYKQRLRDRKFNLV